MRISHFIITIKFILFFIVFYSFSVVYSQKIETVVYNGKTYFEYPFKASFNPNNYYYYGIKVKKFKKIMADYYRKNDGKELSEVEYKKAIKLYKKELRAYKKSLKKQDNLYDAELREAINKNPYPFLEITYFLDNDITPCLDKIPDGEYIQFFNEFPLVDGKGDYTLVNNKVAGIFNIKNNLLDGEAIWLNIKGDTLKKGKFLNGLKESQWTIETRYLKNRRLTTENKDFYVKNGYPKMDTSIEVTTFSNGLKSGYYSYKGVGNYPIIEGFYKNNEKAGSWIERKPNITYDLDFNEILDKNNKVVTAEYTFSDSLKVVKQPVVRHRLINADYVDVEGFNFESTYTPFDVSNRLFTIAFPKNELEEVESEEYEMEEYSEEELMDMEEESAYDDYNSISDFDYTKMIYDESKDKYIKRGKAIDSLGLSFTYNGIYERHYPNGQLMFKYEFNNGKLLNEDTVFWDNGKPYDVVKYLADSNQYLQTIYDYDGKVFHEIIYDSLGDFKNMKFQPDLFKSFEKDGLIIRDYSSRDFFEYDKMDSIQHYGNRDSVLLWKSWSKEDTSILYNRIYYPKERILKVNGFSLTGKKITEEELTFGENFENWTGTMYNHFDLLTLKSIQSASKYHNYEEEDTIPIRNVNDYFTNYEVTSDDILYKGKSMYSGSIKIELNAKKPKVSTKNEINLAFPRMNVFGDELIKDYEKFKKTGKSKYASIYNSLDANELNYGNFNQITSALFPFFQEYMFQPSEYEGEYYEEEEDKKELKEKDFPVFSKTIIGKHKKGKPEGVWKVYDQFGKMLFEVPFLNGEVHGTVKTYNYAEPLNEEYDEISYGEQLPKKKTHYLESLSNYKKGVQQGEAITYNWLGKVVSKENYLNGLLSGPAIERNELAYTTSNYEEGALDGYVQTYLTMVDRDTTLLYQLNFQNGSLQGESKSFHLNGKISKRGFFLDGRPIDDYEAYDSLGMRYHYVKFLYSFPVEEKIWEESQLSVRYLFDWKDSIYFRPTDITSSQSLDAVLAEHGIGMDYYSRPYYGRPSLVNKNGVNYHLTKYYPNDSIARDGDMIGMKKKGLWKYYDYYGKKLYEVNYFDTTIKLNDSISFISKGIYSKYDSLGTLISKSYIIEKYEKYDCSHSDHYEIRQFYIFWEKTNANQINGYVKHHYDNGTLQSEGQMKNGLPSGVWKFYDPYGKLNQVGMYVNGKRDGRWLGGDLSKTKYLGDICLNPNLPDLEETIKMREKQLDITITNYLMGKPMNKEFYDVDWSEVEKEEAIPEIEEE